mgnify:CR=1 FL=1
MLARTDCALRVDERTDQRAQPHAVVVVAQHDAAAAWIGARSARDRHPPVVAAHAARNGRDWLRRVLAWQDVLYGSDLPDWLKDLKASALGTTPHPGEAAGSSRWNPDPRHQAGHHPSLSFY